MHVRFGTRRACALVVAGLLTALPTGALAQGFQNSINVTFGAIPSFGDVGATVILAEYERLVIPKLSVYGRFMWLDYKWDDDVYIENGSGPGFGGGVRFYPAGGLKGFFVGGGVSPVSTDWDWTDDVGTTFQTKGTGSSTAIQVGADVGYRFAFGSGRVSIMPALQFGNWVGADDTCTYTAPASQAGRSCDKTTEIGFYVFPSVSLGVAF